MNESACSIPAKRSRAARGAQRGEPVGAVDVQPQPALAAHLGHAGEVVDQADVRRARGRDHGEDAVAPVGVEGRAQRGAGEPALRSGHRERPGVHHPQHRRHRRVDLGAAGDARGGGARVPGARARRVQGGEVAVRAALDEAAARRVRQPGQAGEPAQRLVLRVHRARALQPRAAVDRVHGQQHVGQRRRGRLGRRDEREVARMVDLDRGRQHLAHEQRRGALGAEAGGRDRASEALRERLRRRGGAERRRVGGEPLARGRDDRLLQRGVAVVQAHARLCTFSAWI